MKFSQYLLACLSYTLMISSTLQASESFPLWSGPDIPADPEKVPFAKGIKHYTLLDGSQHTHHFLHGAAIIHHKGLFHVNWANSPKHENKEHETLQGIRFSDVEDKGTWSDVEVIGSDLPGLDRRSHAAYLNHDGKLWTFAARFGVDGPKKRFTGLKAEGFMLNDISGKWESQGIVMTNCWPYDEAVKMSNGNYITGGQDRAGLPVIAISHGSDLTRWDSVLIPYPPELGPQFAETTVWAEGLDVTAVIRGGKGVAWIAGLIIGTTSFPEEPLLMETTPSGLITFILVG